MNRCLFVTALLMHWAIGAMAQDADIGPMLQESMIWSGPAPTDKQAYVVFRKTFQLQERPESAVMRLFADSRYMLWINGRYVDRGPCRFDPKGPEFDTLDVCSFLAKGGNAVAVLVHHYDDGNKSDSAKMFNGRIMRHAPGLTAAMELVEGGGRKQVIHTDGTWRTCAHNRFQPSPAEWSSVPDRIDARRDSGDWTSIAFDDSQWAHALPIDGKQWGALRARRIPLLRETAVEPLAVVQSSKHDCTGTPNPAALLPLEMTSGDQLVFDVGQFVQAYSVLDFEADPGSQLTVGYAQSFHSSGDVPGGYGANVNQYTARAGRQTYISGDTFGCKYVFVRMVSGRIRLFGVRMMNRIYPFDVVGTFTSNDPLLDDIWKLGVRTVQICSEDAHVDCATRERAEWIADTVMLSYPIASLAMSGPGCDGRPYWSDPRLFGNMLRHIGQSVQPDGRVKAHHPSNRWDQHGYIEDFSCLWIHGLRMWHNNTNDLDPVREVWPAVTSQLRWLLARRSERGLVRAREFVFLGNPLAYQICEGAALNAFVYQALADAAELARLLGCRDQEHQYVDASQAVRKAINDQLWNDKIGAYSGGIKDDARTAPTVHAAAMCLYFDVVPAKQRKRLEEWFFTRIEQENPWPYQFAYYFELLGRMDSDVADRRALDLIRRLWAPMARFETQTTWENFKPEENCHQIGGAPTIYLSRHVLGVRLDGSVVSKRIAIRPHLTDLTTVAGKVVTQLGPVSVRWHQDTTCQGIDWSVDIPDGARATVSLPATNEISTLTVDGDAIALNRTSSRRVSFEIGSGSHSGQLR